MSSMKDDPEPHELPLYNALIAAGKAKARADFTSHVLSLTPPDERPESERELRGRLFPEPEFMEEDAA